MLAMRSSIAPVAGRRAIATAARITPRRALVVRAQEDNSVAPTVATEAAPLAAAPEGASFTFLGATQEALNGRAAMLGFVAAVISESLTHHSVLSQMLGVTRDGEVVEAAYGSSILLYFAVVLLTTMATLVPKLVYGLEVDSRSFGPFTPGLEKTLGRVAQLGFLGLLVVEVVKGSALLG